MSASLKKFSKATCANAACCKQTAYRRIYEANGQAQEGKLFKLTVPVEKGMPLVISTLNWDSPFGDSG